MKDAMSLYLRPGGAAAEGRHDQEWLEGARADWQNIQAGTGCHQHIDKHRQSRMRFNIECPYPGPWQAG